MPTSQLEEIREKIGENAKDDYLLLPEKHIERYEGQLPDLAALLKLPTVRHFAEEYQKYDQEARKVQSKFKNYSKWARLFTFLAAAFSATLVMSGTLTGSSFIQSQFGWLPETLLMVSTVLAIIFSGASSAVIMIIKNQKLLEKWMSRRAAAEEYRIQYFEELGQQLKEGAGPATGMAILEYFRRYQLDIQIAYYEVRAAEMEEKSNKATAAIAILAGLVIIINGITGSLGLDWAFLAALAIIAQAFSAMISNRELNDQNERNAERYAKLRKELSLLRARIGEVRKGIAEGNTTVLKTYMKAIHDSMATEHRQWLETMRSGGLAMDELEAELAKISTD